MCKKKKKKKGYSRLHVVTHLWQFMGQNSEIWGVKKIQQRFSEAEPLDSNPHQTPPGCRTPPKMVPPYSLGTCPPKTPITLSRPVPPSSRKHRLSEDPCFWPKYSNGPGVAKNWHMSKWTYGTLGDVSSCLETKFDKEMSMGSVPNCQKEIANRYGIRWFKCKLKPPKNKSQKFTDQDPGTTQPEGNSIHLNYKLIDHTCWQSVHHEPSTVTWPSTSIIITFFSLSIFSLCWW